MNPPFHLRKSEDLNLLRDTWDYDFIKKAFGLLKVGGELIAITSNKWKSNEEFKKWAKTNTKTFNFDDKPKEKFSGIVIDVSILKFTKINDSEDNEILNLKYYTTDNDKGKLLNKSEISPNKIMNNYETKTSMKIEANSIENRQLKIFKDNLLL